MHSAHVLVSGEVQDVGFRSYVKRSAMALGLKGWVRNTKDGWVEAVFEGDKKAIEDMLEACKRGPEFSAVDKIEVKWIRPEGFKGFEVRF